MCVNSLYLKVGSTRAQVFYLLGFSKEITEFIGSNRRWTPFFSKAAGRCFTSKGVNCGCFLGN